jgi:hypothetical protein
MSFQSRNAARRCRNAPLFVVLWPMYEAKAEVECSNPYLPASLRIPAASERDTTGNPVPHPAQDGPRFPTLALCALVGRQKIR